MKNSCFICQSYYGEEKLKEKVIGLCQNCSDKTVIDLGYDTFFWRIKRFFKTIWGKVLR